MNDAQKANPINAEIAKLRAALEQFASEDFYWRYKPWIDEDGKEHPGLIKNVQMLQEFAKESLGKINE